MAKIRIASYRRSGYKKDVIPGYGKKIKYIKPTTVKGHLKKDTGAPGKTKKEDRWFTPDPGKNLHGWEKDMSATKRRKLASIGRNDLSSGRALQQLVNVTTDRATKKSAKADADYFFRRHRG